MQLQSFGAPASLRELIDKYRRWNTTVVVPDHETLKVLTVVDRYTNAPDQEFKKFTGGMSEPYETCPFTQTGPRELWEETRGVSPGPGELQDRSAGLRPHWGARLRYLDHYETHDDHLRIALWIWRHELTGRLISEPVDNHNGYTSEQQFEDFYALGSKIVPGQKRFWDKMEMILRPLNPMLTKQ